MIIENYSGKSIIRLRVRSETGEHALFVKETAVAIDFPDNSGSIARYFYSLPYENVAEKFKELTESLNTGQVNSDLPIEQNFRFLLELFEPGEYMLDLCPIDLSGYQIEKPPINYYPTKNVFLWTQPESEINESRVGHYIDLINAGKRPIAVIVGMLISYGDWFKGSPNYILDGHHKLTAYMQLNIAPRILYIERVVNNWTDVEFDYFSDDEEFYYKMYNACHLK